MKSTADSSWADTLFRLGGEMDRSSLSKDSAMGAAWHIGDLVAKTALQRLARTQDLLPSIEIAVGRKQALNAVATSVGLGYGAVLFWPLLLTLQGVAAAIWAHPLFLPWIGDVSCLKTRFSTVDPHPPGFDLYLGLIGKIELDPKDLRSGVRRDDVDAIAAAGEERWTAFLSCWNGAFRFIWGHELAHILYGHVDIARTRFASQDLYETEGEEDSHRVSTRPPELSQFMEYVADMDAATNIFVSLYDSAPRDRESQREWRVVLVSTFIGMVICAYVLQVGKAYMPFSTETSSHPPIRHRACWLIAAENSALEALDRLKGPDYRKELDLPALRALLSDALRDFAALNNRLWNHIADIDDKAMAEANEYLNQLRNVAAPYFDLLERAQKVR